MTVRTFESTAGLGEIFLLILFVSFLIPTSLSGQPNAIEEETELSAATRRVRDAIRYWRDQTSYTEATMTVHRSDWERKMSLRGWTQGMKKSLIRFTRPAKDAGSASLKVDQEMWSFSPKINRVIKIPPSMMTQSWMGSDFSYNDLAKADEIVHQYKHTITGTEIHDGMQVEIIEAIPFEEAPVVWGKEILKVRSDNVLLEHTFFDQDLKPIKRLSTLEIRDIGGKIYPTVMKMESLEEEDRWTQIEYEKARFGFELDDKVFTLSYLRNPRTIKID